MNLGSLDCESSALAITPLLSEAHIHSGYSNTYISNNVLVILIMLIFRFVNV